MERIAADAVTFDDVLLVPSFSEVLPSDVSSDQNSPEI